VFRTTNPTGEEESLEILRDRTRAWWLSVIAGQTEDSHPIHGTSVKTEVHDGVLTLSGSVRSEEDHREIVTEAEHLRAKGIVKVVDRLEIVPESGGDQGLLVQTLIGIFENTEQAGFAEGYLEGHAHITPDVMKVLAPDADEAQSVLSALLPMAWVDDAGEALRAGRSLLLVTVDETEAFRTRELLDEETRSLRTLVLPPEPARNAEEEQRRLSELPRSANSRKDDADAERARADAVKREAAVHEP
jgi:hypothetical protein